MLQIHLQIINLLLRVKTPVQVIILINKQKWRFKLKQRQTLINGNSQFTSQQVFFICQRSPTFQIQVLLKRNDQEKFGGKCVVNLANIKNSQFNQFQQPLQNSFDPKSRIKYSFKVLKSNLSFKQELISHYQIQQQQSNQIIRELRTQNEVLKRQSQKMRKQMESIKLEKEVICKEKGMNNAKYIQNNKEKDKMLIEKKEQIQMLKNQLQKQRFKFARMVDLLNEHGDPQLMQQMQQVLDQKADF